MVYSVTDLASLAIGSHVDVVSAFQETLSPDLVLAHLEEMVDRRGREIGGSGHRRASSASEKSPCHRLRR